MWWLDWAIPQFLAVVLAHCSFLSSMNCRSAAIACDSVLIVPTWTDFIPAFRTSACDGINSLP